MNKLIKGQDGFTLLELMITVTLLGILAAIALPSFGDLVKSNRITTQANSVVASLHYARNETVNRGVDVRIEPVVTGTDWSAGWRVRIDGNNDGDFSDAEDIIIRNYEAVNSSTLTNTVSQIVYSPNGQVNAASTLTLLANECNGDYKRVIKVKLSGLIWLDPDDRSCP